MGAGYGPNIVTDGLVLNLDAANKRSYPGSGTTWHDLTKNKVIGTLTNGPTYSSANGGSLVFDNTNDYIQIPYSDIFNFGTSDWTIEFWVKCNSLQSNDTYIALNSNITGNAYAAIRITSTATGAMYLLCSTNGSSWINTSTSATGTLVTGIWNHIVATRSGSNFTLYVNKISKLTYSSASSLYNGNQVSTIGALYNFSSPTDFINGNISQVRVYKGKSLNSNEILQNFNATKSRFNL